jgi:hypothetical protein
MIHLDGLWTMDELGTLDGLCKRLTGSQTMRFSSLDSRLSAQTADGQSGSKRLPSFLLNSSGI